MWRYKLLILMLTPIIVIYTIVRAIKYKDYRYLTQRFCISTFKNVTNQTSPVWIHAASVGEVIAVIPLIQQLIKRHPDIQINITSNTNTGAEIVKNQMASLPMVNHYYMPIDWKWAVQKIILAFQPRCILIVETELWPNLFHYSHQKNIPIIIINARLSHRTTSAKPWILQLYKHTLKNVTLILARSTEDYQSYLKLGALDSKIKLMGNIKLSSNNDQKLIAIPVGRPYVLAASTHQDEELQLTTLWMELIKNKIVTNEMLVIVPRHPERASSILQQLKNLTEHISIRSKNHAITTTTQVYIADTVGELKQFMIDAKFIFIGGSLISHGGQNIIEPAQLAKAIIFGQHMFNFKDESKLLLENNAAIQVKNKAELYNSFEQLLTNSKRVTQLSESASKVVQEQENSVLHSYLTEIEKIITPK